MADDAELLPVRIDDDVATSVDAEALLPEVTRALAVIPERDREALLLVAWEELSYAEVAAVLDIPIGTVRSRIARARARLRDLLPGAER